MIEKWKLLPIEATDEMHVAALKATRSNSNYHDFGAEVWAAMIEVAPKPQNETMTREEAQVFQDWAGMDGAVAFHLIERHAVGWSDVGRMMSAWLEANR